MQYAVSRTHKDTGDDISLLMDITKGNELKILTELENMLWQARETLSQLAHKQRTWDQKEENQVVPQEHVSSTHNSGQRLLEKEQSQRTVKTSKQYIISYPEGHSIDLVSGMTEHNSETAGKIAESLRDGITVVIPEQFKVQVIDL
jgi:transcriptional regulator of heat shock response